MHRTEGTNNASNLFTNGPPGTTVEQNWLNAVQEELINTIVTIAGLPLLTAGSDTRDQLANAIKTIIQSYGHNSTFTHDTVEVDSGGTISTRVFEDGITWNASWSSPNWSSDDNTKPSMYLQYTTGASTGLKVLYKGPTASTWTTWDAETILINTDGRIGALSGDVYSQSTNPTDIAFSCGLSTDSQARFRVDNNGKISIGTGAAAPDTNLYRDSANTLKTDDDLIVAGGRLTALNGDFYSQGTSGTDTAYTSDISTDTQARHTVDVDGKHMWGPGGASASDTNLYRSATNTLKTDDNLEIVGKLVGTAGTVNVYRSGVQSIPNGVSTKVEFNAETLDSDSVFDSTTNYRYQPTVEGVYRFTACVEYTNPAADCLGTISILRNTGGGSSFSGTLKNTHNISLLTSTILPMNGTSNYVEVLTTQASGGALNISGTSLVTYFTAELIALSSTLP